MKTGLHHPNPLHRSPPTCRWLVSSQPSAGASLGGKPLKGLLATSCFSSHKHPVSPLPALFPGLCSSLPEALDAIG